MISALRKIEGRGELVRANSAVMEMCVDNPREGFADIFATHPSVEKRVEAHHRCGRSSLRPITSAAQPPNTRATQKDSEVATQNASG